MKSRGPRTNTDDLEFSILALNERFSKLELIQERVVEEMLNQDERRSRRNE